MSTFINQYNKYINNSDLIAGFPLPLSVSGGLPLDINSVKLTLSDLINYANDASDNAHPGKLVTVVNDEIDENNGLYIINKVARYDDEGSVTKLIGSNGINTTKLFEVVTELPETGTSNLIYLIYNENESGYEQFVWKNNKFESLGIIKINIEEVNNSKEFLKLFDNCFFVNWKNLDFESIGYNLNWFVKPGIYFLYGTLPLKVGPAGFPNIKGGGPFIAYLQVINGNHNISASDVYKNTCKQILSFNFSETVYTRIGNRVDPIENQENLLDIYNDDVNVPKYTFNAWSFNLNSSDLIDNLENADALKPLASSVGRTLNNKINNLSKVTFTDGLLEFTGISVTNGINS